MQREFRVTGDTLIQMTVQEHELPIQEYSHIYIQLAAYEMGEHHVAQARPRVIGELSLAEVYLSKIISLNNEVTSCLASRCPLQCQLIELSMMPVGCGYREATSKED